MIEILRTATFPENGETEVDDVESEKSNVMPLTAVVAGNTNMTGDVIGTSVDAADHDDDEDVVLIAGGGGDV